MKITIESTTQLVDVNGVPARVWEGETETGIKVIALITRVAVGLEESPEVHGQFKKELQECRPPSAEVAIWPLSLIL
jgi:hypothetical protein